MNTSRSGRSYTAVIRLAQYLSGLTTQQDVFREVGGALVSFLGADFVSFVDPEPGGGLTDHHWTWADPGAKIAVLPDLQERIQGRAGEEDESRGIRGAVLETLESGFLTARVVFCPNPMSVVFLPITQENHPVSVMLVGTGTSEAVPRELLNIYLAVARMAETTAARLASERELIQYRQLLEERVNERTAELTRINDQLQQEIIQRKQVEKALTRERDNLTRIFEAMEDRIYIINSNYEILYANPAFEQEFPCQEGRKCYERINDHDTACSWCQSGEVLAGRTVRSEWFCERLDKSYDRIAAPLRNADGSLTMLTIFRDITERKRSEMQLQEVNRRLEAATARANEMALQARNASRSKSEFLANMSHEIRTPLNGVIGMTELMLGGELSSEQRRYAEMARSSGQHLLALLNDILDLSKVEAGKLDLETVDFDLQVLLDDVAGAMALPAREKGIELRCAAAPAVPTFLKGDPGRLRQILNNLTGNAVKFTDAGEVSIDISLEAESPDRVLLRFTVRDTGIGIRADKIDMLFQKFVQLDASTTRRYGGTGLGLIISKQLAYMMQGDIGVESEEGRGSRFWFTAWLGKQPREARGTVSSSAVPSSAPREIRPLAGADQCRLLVVEDHPVNREVTLGILEKLGFRADVAATGREALNALIKRPYDLVFMDVQMPDMDGLTATRRIRNADQNICNVPVIAMTAHALAGDRKRCLAAGMTDYIPKPVNSQALADVLSRWLPAVEPDPGGQNSSVAGQPQVPSSPSDSQSQETRSARPLFDASGFWKRVMGDKAFGGKIIVAFLKDIPVQMASLQAALSADDPDRTARQAHTIKGAVANMGGEACCGLAIEIEQAAKAKDLASARRLTARMQEALESLENALKEEVESLETGQQGDQM